MTVFYPDATGPRGYAGVMDNSKILAANNKPQLSCETGITASTTQTLVGARQLDAGLNEVTSANANDAVKLPPTKLGGIIYVWNSSANAITVYPYEAATAINGGSAGASVTVAAGKLAIFTSVYSISGGLTIKAAVALA